MKDFKNFSPETTLPKALQDSLNDLAGKSPSDLLPLLLGEAKRAREQGKLTDREIDEFYQKISSALTPFQKTALNSLLEDVKKIPTKDERRG